MPVHWTIRKWLRALPWMVLACAAACCAMAVYTWRFVPDCYRASAALYAMPKQNTTFAVRMLASDCRALVETEEFAYQIGLEEGVRLEVSAAEDSHLIEIAAAGYNVQAVFETANRAANALQIALETVLQAQNTTMVQLPQLPTQPIGPDRMGRLLWTALISFAFASLLGGCMGEDSRKLRFQDPSAEAFRLGVMTDTHKERLRYQKNIRKNKTRGMFLQHVDRLTSESIRRSVLEMRRVFAAANARAVVMASVTHNEESAAAAALTASELAQQGFSVLLMEMDAKHAALGELLGVKAKADLVDFFEKHAEQNEMICQTEQPSLCLIDWLHSETELAKVAASQAFSDFLKNACEHFDYVLVHAPAVRESSDAALITLSADEVILTIPDGKLTEKEVLEAADQLRRCGKPALGVLFTGVKHWKLEMEE